MILQGAKQIVQPLEVGYTNRPKKAFSLNAACLWTLRKGRGWHWVGIWNQAGPWIRRCPRWVTSQQSAELWGVLAGLERAQGPANLFVDNTGALSTSLWGRANIALPEQQRIIRRLAQRLRWQGGGGLQLHYVPS